MSNVRKNRQKESRVEFDNTYFRIHDDAMLIIKNSFGAKDGVKQEYRNYIEVISKKVFNIIFDIGTNIRIANSIYPTEPTAREEYAVRRAHQEKAIGLCFDLLTKYQLAMKVLKVPDDKYTVETKNLIHEINCLKKWRSSDRKRYENLG